MECPSSGVRRSGTAVLRPRGACGPGRVRVCVRGDGGRRAPAAFRGGDVSVRGARPGGAPRPRPEPPPPCPDRRNPPGRAALRAERSTAPREPPPGEEQGLGKATLSGVPRSGVRAARARSRRSLRPGRNHTTEEKQ
ncbi:hypothetical protein GCM10009551_032760 [Nocardiopsis tropica]